MAKKRFIGLTTNQFSKSATTEVITIQGYFEDIDKSMVFVKSRLADQEDRDSWTVIDVIPANNKKYLLIIVQHGDLDDSEGDLGGVDGELTVTISDTSQEPPIPITTVMSPILVGG